MSVYCFFALWKVRNCQGNTSYGENMLRFVAMKKDETM